MANRMKEDEKNERIIRGLLKLPENRRCINCNSLGPQYVCTNFWTFVCMTCGGIHREFTHRVKSVSMATFTSQEVSSLQGGGNENARQMYFKDLDMQRLPDNSNVERLRDFIKRVYVDRRYTGERNSDPPLRTRMGDRDNFYENKGENTRGSSRSPLYEETYDRRHGDRFGSSETRYNFGEKSPGHEQESRYRDYGRSPGRFDLSADGRQDNRMRSPSHKQDLPTSPPAVRPVRDILGENVPSLHVGDSQKVNVGISYGRNEPSQAPTTSISSLNSQRTESSSGLTSSNTNSVDPKRENFGSLIDFDADPEPAASIPSTDVFSAPSSINQLDDNNWASFDSISQGKTIETSSNINPLESSLLPLSTAPAVPVRQTLPLVMGAGAGDSSTKIVDGRQFPGLQPHSSSIFATSNSLSTGSQFISPVSGDTSNQAWSSFTAGNTPSSLISQSGQQSQIAANPFQGTQIAPSQVPNVEPQPSGRKELPENLFTRTYSPTLGPPPGWHPSPNFPGYGMPFSTVQQQLKYPGPILPTNPFEFDITNRATLGYSSTFPSLVSLQGELQSMGSSTLVRSASVDTLPLQWIRNGPQIYPAPASGSGFMAQNASFPMPPFGHNADGNIGNQSATFSSVAREPQQSSSYIQPTPSNNPFPSRGGNPFE